MHQDQTLSRRKEPRFKTCEGKSLLCAGLSDSEDDSRQGTIVDISTSGLRVLCEGQFEVGQEFTTELLTDRTHGTYRGIIRRVVPWVGGELVLGCQLLDPIPADVLGGPGARRYRQSPA